MQPCLPEPTWNRGSIVDQMWPMSKAFGCRLWISNSNSSLFLWSTFCSSDEVLEPSFCFLVSVKYRYQILKPVDSKESEHSGGRPSNPDQMQKAWSMITVKTEKDVWQQNRLVFVTKWKVWKPSEHLAWEWWWHWRQTMEKNLDLASNFTAWDLKRKLAAILCKPPLFPVFMAPMVCQDSGNKIFI